MAQKDPRGSWYDSDDFKRFSKEFTDKAIEEHRKEYEREQARRERMDKWTERIVWAILLAGSLAVIRYLKH